MGRKGKKVVKYIITTLILIVLVAVFNKRHIGALHASRNIRNFFVNHARRKNTKIICEEFFYPMRCVNKVNANSSAVNDLSFLLNNNTDTDDEPFP